MLTGAHKQKHARHLRLRLRLRRRRRRRRRYRCISPHAVHASDTGVVDAESESADADGSRSDTWSWSDCVVWTTLRTLASR